MIEKKGLFVTCLVLLLVLLSSVTAAAMQLEVDGNVLNTAVTLKNERSFLLLREFGKTVGADVFWDHQKKIAYITRDGVTVAFADGEIKYQVNEGVRLMDVEPYIMNGRIYVPVRFAAESLGYRVVFAGKEKIIRLYSEAPVLSTDLQRKNSFGNSVEFILTVKNSGNVPVELVLPGGQDFDMVVRQDGEEIYRWSDGKFFTLALRNVTYAPGEENQFSWEWLPPAAGTYEIEVYYLGVSREEPLVRETLVVDWEPSA